MATNTLSLAFEKLNRLMRAPKFQESHFPSLLTILLQSRTLVSLKPSTELNSTPQKLFFGEGGGFQEMQQIQSHNKERETYQKLGPQEILISMPRKLKYPIQLFLSHQRAIVLKKSNSIISLQLLPYQQAYTKST